MSQKEALSMVRKFQKLVNFLNDLTRASTSKLKSKSEEQERLIKALEIWKRPEIYYTQLS